MQQHGTTERTARAQWPVGGSETASLAPGRDGALSIEQLQVFFRDQYYEPNWRAEAELDCAYYDGDQLTSETLQRMRDNGILPSVVNLCAPSIDAVSGLEIITRHDLRCVAVDDRSYETAQAMNQQLYQAIRETRFNQKISDLYKEAVKRGLAWLEVSRNSDPFDYPYRVINVPWREMYYDWRAREPDLSDLRYVIRRRWFDEDELLSYFPQPGMKALIRQARTMQGSISTDNLSFGQFEQGFFDFPHTRNLGAHEYSEERWTTEQEEWIGNARSRIGLLEVLYRVPRQVGVLEMPTGHVIELDRNDPRHLELLQSGQVRYRKGRTSQWRQTFIVANRKLADHPLALNRPHYIPMVAYRKDNNGAPYGLVRRMRGPQDAYNARNTRIIWDTMNRTYLVDEDAVDNVEETARQLNKPVSAIPLKADRRSEAGISKLPGAETTAYTMQMMQESKVNIYDVTGLRPEFMGQVQSAGQSGVAIDQLIEQSSKVLGVVADNHRQAKLKAGQLLHSMIVMDLMDRDNHDIETRDRQTGRQRTITLNRVAEDGSRDNQVFMARLEIELEPTPSTETYRQQKFAHLTEVLKSMPPEMTASMMDIVVKASQLPDEEEIIERIRSMTGFGPEPRDPQVRAELAAQQQRQQQLEQRMQELEMMLAEGEARLAQAKADSEAAKAEKLATADTDYTEAQTIETLAKANAVQDEQTRKEIESQAGLIKASAELRKAKSDAEKPATTPAAKAKPKPKSTGGKK